MIFVTVGNATQGFRRLLDAVDILAGEKAWGNETVFIQSGNNPGFRPAYCKHEPFVPMDDFALKFQEAAVIVSHAGTGTLFHALQAGKVPVVMPRRKKYGEIIDDHQLELVQALASEGRVIPAYEPMELPAAIAEARQRTPGSALSPSTEMHQLVAKAFEELMRERV